MSGLSTHFFLFHVCTPLGECGIINNKENLQYFNFSYKGGDVM